MQLRNQEQLLYFDKQTVTIIEIKIMDDPVISRESVAVYTELEKVARNFLREGFSPEVIARNTGLPLFFIYEIKKDMDQEMSK